VHLVGFTIRIYHDSRSPERQIDCLIVCNVPTNLYVSDQFVKQILNIYSYFSVAYCRVWPDQGIPCALLSGKTKFDIIVSKIKTNHITP
jgi:hypothetical protein